MAGYRNSKRFRDLATQLRDTCALHDVELSEEASRDMLASKIDQIAAALRITPRWAMDQYLDDDGVERFATAVATQVDDAREIMQATLAMDISVPDAARVVAALGICARHALGHLEDDFSSAEAAIRDCTDTVVILGIALAQSGGGSIQLGGMELAVARKTMTTVIEKLRGQWTCPCTDRHTPERLCRLQQSLIDDLGRLGGWVTDAGETNTRHPMEDFLGDVWRLRDSE